MAILTVFNVTSMTAAQYDRVLKDLEAAGQGKPKGRVSTWPPVRTTAASL